MGGGRRRAWRVQWPPRSITRLLWPCGLLPPCRPVAPLCTQPVSNKTAITSLQSSSSFSPTYHQPTTTS